MNLKPFPGLYVPSVRDFRRAVQKLRRLQVMRCTDDFQPDDFSSFLTAARRFVISVSRSKGVGKADKIAPFRDGKADRRRAVYSVMTCQDASARMFASLPDCLSCPA